MPVTTRRYLSRKVKNTRHVRHQNSVSGEPKGQPTVSKKKAAIIQNMGTKKTLNIHSKIAWNIYVKFTNE